MRAISTLKVGAVNAKNVSRVSPNGEVQATIRISFILELLFYLKISNLAIVAGKL